MSQENVETFKRAIDAYNSRDIEAMVEEVDPEVEWRPAWGEAAVYRGHEGVRKLFRELDDVLDELHLEYSETRDLGDRVVAIGRVRMRGRGKWSGDRVAARYRGRSQERQGDSGSDLPQPQGSPRSRRAVGVVIGLLAQH
jgi:ketosteroid isomerase-like protein